MQKFFYPATVFIIALGFLQNPPSHIGPPSKSFWSVLIDTLQWMAWLAPLFPLVIMLLRQYRSTPVNQKTAQRLAILILLTGACLTFMLMVVSGPASEMTFVQGAALTIACSVSVDLLCLEKSVSVPSTHIGKWLFIPLLVAVWSLAAIPMIYFQSRSIAGDHPFCVATHAPAQAVQSLAQVRGLSFYTNSTGYKWNSYWYFHGLLIVNQTGKPVVYNWSPRRFRFDKIENPERQFSFPGNACEPVVDFWSNTRIF